MSACGGDPTPGAAGPDYEDFRSFPELTDQLEMANRLEAAQDRLDATQDAVEPIPDHLEENQGQPEVTGEVDAGGAQSDVVFTDLVDSLGPLPEYAPTGFVGTDGVVFRDEIGRMLILRGVNVSNGSKGPPFFPAWLEQGHFQELADRGFNVVRFLVIWEAVEPEEGVFDSEYLDMVEDRVQWATDAGLYVLVDMHQDIWGPKFGGDGAPGWATLDHGLPFNPSAGMWFLKYGEPAVCQAFQSFWDNEQGIRKASRRTC